MNVVTQWMHRISPGRAGYAMPLEVWPDTVTATARSLECGQGVSATFLVTGYPSEVGYAWAEALIDTGLHAEVSLHVAPVATATAVNRLRRRRARLESARYHAADHERLDDPYVEAAAAEAAELSGRIATGETLLFELGVYVTVHAIDNTDLDNACTRLRAHAAASMLDVRPASWRQLPGRYSTLPIGVDALNATRTVDTDTAAAAFPFTSPDAPNPPSGVLYGLNLATNAPVIWDRWNCDNHNSVLVARSGSGKSYFTKCEVLRQLYDGVNVTVIDPDGEYTPLAEHVDGTITRPGHKGEAINPLDLPGNPTSDALTRRILFTHTLVSTLLGEDVTGDAAAALDDATLTAYEQAGITADPATWHHDPPALLDVMRLLTHPRPEHSHVPSQAGAALATRLHHYVDGGLSDLLCGPTTQAATAHLTVYDLSALPDELLAAGCLVVLDRITNTLTGTDRTLVVVDEAWRLLSTGPGATFLARLAKSARKRRTGLMTVTQDAEDLLSTDLGRIVIQNCATQILMRQSAQAMDLVADAFALTDAEHALLTSARRGEALLRSGDVHVAFTAIASEAEHALCLTGLSDGPGEPS